MSKAGAKSPQREGQALAQPKRRGLPLLIVILAILSLLLYFLGRLNPVWYFLCIMGSGLMLGLALLLLLFLPWQRRGLQRASIILRWAYLAAALGLLFSFIVVQSSIWRYAEQARQQPPEAQYLLVLGAGLRGDTPSLVLQSRLQVALEYLRANPKSQALLSGGQGPGETIPEALAMSRWLAERGIAENRLHMEDSSTSTGENIAFSMPLLATLGQERVVLVSNDFHLLRASLLAAHYGLEVEPLPAPTPSYALLPLSSYCREYFALVKDLFLLKLLPRALP